MAGQTVISKSNLTIMIYMVVLANHTRVSKYGSSLVSIIKDYNMDVLVYESIVESGLMGYRVCTFYV